MEHRPDIDSFYHLARGTVPDAACRGMACFVARHLDPGRWAAASSREPAVSCLGKCYAAPAIGADDARPRAVVRAREAVVLERIVRGGARALARYGGGRYAALEKAVAGDPDQIVRAIAASGLRGRGGAGFSTGRKWGWVHEQVSTEKYAVANADEGDPGAYVDRMLLEDDPHALVEGLAIAAYAVGASRGFVYLRNEYPDALPILERALDEARRAGYLGDRILGTRFSFDVEIVLGKGSYVCGEETALLESIEGKRPEARCRPPYPAARGLWGRPTLVNNVETLACIPWIVREGADRYHALGFSASRGTKVVSLNSLFERPGLYEVELGISVRELVEELGGGLKTGRIKGVIVGGPLAGIIPPERFDTPFGFEELRAVGASVGHGGVIAFDERTSIPALVHHVFGFGAFESCGKCTPCRLGTRRAERMFAHALDGTPLRRACRGELTGLIEALSHTSLCGFGSGLAEFVESAVRYYPAEVDACFE
jgi:NADH:ubiquinone oxidoreductase subunit F (NADH-binding)